MRVIRRLVESDAGVSLVEIMVVLFVITVGIIPIAAIQMHSSRDVMKSGQRTQALTVAQNQMERVRNLGFNAAVSDSGAVDDYKWTTTVSDEGPGLRRVVVTVRWQEGSSQRDIMLNNLLSTR